MIGRFIMQYNLYMNMIQAGKAKEYLMRAHMLEGEETLHMELGNYLLCQLIRPKKVGH